jgi:hypothetical protein
LLEFGRRRHCSSSSSFRGSITFSSTQLELRPAGKPHKEITERIQREEISTQFKDEENTSSAHTNIYIYIYIQITPCDTLSHVYRTHVDRYETRPWRVFCCVIIASAYRYSITAHRIAARPSTSRKRNVQRT